jgi:hypothetical protein
MLINSPAIWWAVFDNNRANLRRLVEDFHPTQRNQEIAKQFPVSAPIAEAINERVVARSDLPLLPVMEFDEAARVRDHNSLIRLLNATWFGVPESKEARTLPGFMDLCDLCSESSVFDAIERDDAAE